MKFDRPHIVQVSTQRVQDMLEAPHLNLVVVTAAGKHTSRRVKIDRANWAIMLLKAIQQRSNPVVPQLNGPTSTHISTHSEAKKGIEYL